MKNGKNNQINLDQIKAIPIEHLMAEEGYKIDRSTHTSIFYSSPIRKEKTASFSISKSKNRWTDFGDSNSGGDIIDLAMKLWGTDFKTTIFKLQAIKKGGLNNQIITATSKSDLGKIELKKIKAIQNQALLSYLKSRSINIEVAKENLREVYYYLNDKHYFALAFINDREGYEIRNKYFKGCIPPKYFTHINNNSSSITVFEGFIDYLSLQTYKPITTDILILNSCSLAPQAIPTIALYDKAYLMLDNDKTGNFTTDLIIKKSGISCIDIRHLIGSHKDVNDWLLATKK